MGLNFSFHKTWGFLWFWLPPLLWGGAILTLSGDLGSGNNTRIFLSWLLSWAPVLSPNQVNLLHFVLRKIGHAVAYGSLYFLWFRAFRGYLDYPFGRAIFWSLALCLAVSGLDEGHQSLLTSRGGSIRDVALDMGGASLSALITSMFWTPRVRMPAIE